MDYLSRVVGYNPIEEFVGHQVKKLTKSSKRRRSKTQKQKESNFGHKLKNLFDIAKFNVERFINDDQKLFLAGQRSKSRFGLMDNTPKLEKINEDIIVDCAGVVEGNILLATQKSGVLQSDLSATTSSQTSNPVSDYEIPMSQKKIDIMTPELAGALDRGKISNRNALFILAAAYKA
ncbi:hypothetical protein HHI36_014509 [Cryptolaemus montrouzieri]|uniref:Uncharacterized protein n=1 Tax=Cryptolaemus montrouzieri TaxID=559131 RepID=A0ABD2N376_9CUCU